MMGETQLGLLAYILVVAAVLERAIAQCRHIANNFPMVWPMLSLALAGLLVFNYDLLIIKALVGADPERSLFIPPKVADGIVSALTISGGASGIVQAIKKAQGGASSLMQVIRAGREKKSA